MTLKNRTLTLDNEEFEKLKEGLSKYSENPEITVSVIVRQFIKDLNLVLPKAAKQPMGLKNNLAVISMAIRGGSLLTDVDKMIEKHIKKTRA